MNQLGRLKQEVDEPKLNSYNYLLYLTSLSKQNTFELKQYEKAVQYTRYPVWWKRGVELCSIQIQRC